ncbi:homoserine dehydrogenase [Victivallaceae bacterium BBE-744-WT-12]|uniref:Homoserine dehydrogenase n=1 Tax=Victivallis lenta TaxID=2606640 RepID=A0A844G356_9BACT|nr:homoserine dehydrogenase [Victivallis lenta]AVM44955.1 homoserine dehydrogenase [Victivallales bacterium CCUG 44730]MBS1452058.1 homoserine dehydrogenase [Lentisphaeria bacterium]MBS5530301.1 homoserine dehydrogenase [bacterium]MST97796.1 homoserine dehydrogenase [Victivallis lenta]HBP07517.1 homoserine dehydrogenase [Lentisphaeria bacterium]
MKEVKVGIIGFGTVGAGVAENILKNSEVVAKRTGVKLVLTRIADLDITTDRGVAVPRELLTTDAAVAIRESDIVVELVGGTTIAKKFILEAISAGKHVVTANKALLALHGKEIFDAAEKAGVDVCYEASVAGGIPIIKALREGLVSNRISRIYGIMNGTCNYILTRMENEGADFHTVLADAQKLGYAEANPSLDIDGFDTAHKTSILASLAFGRWFGMDPVFVEGIRDLALDDLRYADELGYRIKLLAIIKSNNGKVQMRVHPTLIPKSTLLANISDVFNGVMVEGDAVGQTLFYGRGAGRSATASAVVADITDVALNIAAGSVRRIPAFRPGEQFEQVAAIDDISSRYYLRFMVKDCPGVLASITQILADRGISISSLIQHERYGADGAVPLVILTHKANEREVRNALGEIDTLSINQSPVKLMRIEDI